MWITTWLPHHNLVGTKFLKSTSYNNWCTCKTLHTACAIAQYFNLALEQGITFCFLFLNVTKLLSTKTCYLVIDLLSTFELTQSASNVRLSMIIIKETMSWSFFQVANNLPQNFSISNISRGPELTHHANWICNVRMSHHQIISLPTNFLYVLGCANGWVSYVVSSRFGVNSAL